MGRAGSWRRVRFVAVGAYNSAFAYAVFAATHLLFPRLHYLLVLLVSHVIGVLHGYAGHRWVVFRVRGRFLADLVRFWAVYLVALVVNAVILWFAVEILTLPVLVAQAAGLGLTAVFSWFGHSRFSFRRPGDAGVGSHLYNTN